MLKKSQIIPEMELYVKTFIFWPSDNLITPMSKHPKSVLKRKSSNLYFDIIFKRSPSVSHPPQFNISVQHHKRLISKPEAPQFNTKNPSTHPWTEGFRVLNRGMCWTEEFLVLKWWMRWTEGFWELKRCGRCVQLRR